VHLHIINVGDAATAHALDDDRSYACVRMGNLIRLPLPPVFDGGVVCDDDIFMMVLQVLDELQRPAPRKKTK